jgi:YHS domain-containing protein
MDPKETVEHRQSDLGDFAPPESEVAGSHSSVAREGDAARAVMERDVVCGMQVDPASAAGTAGYHGRTYYFCSKSCEARFEEDPGAFIGADR